MAIYIDANVLYTWKSFAELDRVALTIVAQQIKQHVLVPKVAAWEAEAHFRRDVGQAVKDLSKAQKGVNEAFAGQDVAQPPPLDVDARVTRWRDDLSQFATTLPGNGDDALEGHRREAFRLQPAKPKHDERGKDVGAEGGRDAAIWLEVVRDHSARAEEGHFISENTTQFGKTAELKAELRKDLPASPHAFHNYGSLDDFLAFLGTPKRDAQVSLQEVENRLPRVLRVVLPGSSHVPRAIFGADFDWDAFHYRTEVKAARPTRVLATRRYEQEAEAITVVNAQWELVVDCFQLQREDKIGPVIIYEDAVVAGSIQFYLPDDEDLLAQVVSARLAVAYLPPVTEAIGG